MQNLKKILLIGKPNVGKSSLFNRLARQRLAITSEISGTTRDVNQTQILIHSKPALLLDSGGLDESSELFKSVKKHTLEMAQSADILLFLVDGKLAPDDEDRRLFYALKRLKKPMALVVNKIDSKKDEQRAWEFASFGVKELFNISVSHNSGLEALCAWLSTLLEGAPLSSDDELGLEEFLENYDESAFESAKFAPKTDKFNDDLMDDENLEDENLPQNLEQNLQTSFKNINKNHIKVAIIGRVNVGKSSLLNALVKFDRSVVSDVAGTTIDPVNESLDFKGKVIEFVDTAGIRKRGKIKDLERFALLRTQKNLQSAQIALLVLDAIEGFNELDERIAGLLSKHFLGVIIVLNKWDKSEFEFDKVVKELRLDRFKFLAYAPIISVSAKSGKRMSVILDKILEVFENYTQKISTSKLNDLILEATKAHPLPHLKGKLVKIYYAVQYDISPPKIALIMNRPKALHFSYKRYLQNQIRAHFNFSGVPLVIASRKKGEKDESNA